MKKDGPNVEQDVFSFTTTEPNSATASINHERSPVLLTSEVECATWLGSSTTDALALVKPIAGGRLRIVQEGFVKRDTLAL